ncbi:DUF29 domain-containing protein [Chroococcidiopsis sp. TS-821]|uniref:DUF29 domain-containing protein n=1 Tax=Chroococcidiopsis sp. TS-821 TaxID=1378066 RepID=UPI000CEE8F0B|nr:DUF29 domain-containing protein [Chroococcidiopsis sp. TS-821]PPS42305.1 hypothetical protein B1A85_14840 [Chroococcidiopsis sp. TS-821]
MQSIQFGEANHRPDYDTDYDAWLARQIHSLQHARWHEIDVPHLVEELEGLNKSNERELESYLIVLLAHLLKWEYQPDKRNGSWEASINNSRNRIAKLFKQQKSLEKRVAEFIPEAYQEAKEWASKETKLRIDLFAEPCPYSVEQLQDKNWLPE